ncbi:hypothetical protein GGF43_002624 [Coemansia sp. RSA 2618]|nr:hypothetical protein GGF43_002624 [Coemansia sp. RSA 2618]
MKLAIVPLVFAPAVAAQGDYTAQPQTAEPMVTPMATPIPQVSMPTTMPPTRMSGHDTASLLSRLVSFFDLTHVSTSLSTMPVLMAMVYNPDVGKFVFLSSSVVNSGDTSYVPVCSTDTIISAGTSPVLAQDQSDACPYGIQLTPMPSNAASTLLKTVRIKLRIFQSLFKPAFWRGGMHFKGMRPDYPGMQMMQTKPSVPMMEAS